LGRLRAGSARVVITPPVGTPLSGYASRVEGSIGVHDDLYAKCLILDDGATRVVVIACDVAGFPKRFVADVRRRVEELTGVPGDNVMVTATHTHTGPNNAAGGQDWINVLARMLAGSAYAAWNNMRDARIGAGRGSCYVGVNRRNPASPRRPYWLYPWPDGPMDPEVQVLRVEDADGNITTLLVNYAAHPTSLKPPQKMLWLSRDYPGHAMGVLERAKGGDVVAMYLNGTCGNVAPRDIWFKPDSPPPLPRPSFPEDLRLAFKETERLGNVLGGEALKVAEEITDLTSDVRIRAARREVELPVRERPFPGPYLEKRLRETRPRQNGEEQEHMERIRSGHKTIQTEVQAFAINDIAIVGLPGEVFVEYGLEIKKGSGFKYTVISELANDSIGYVPTPKAYEEGGYEPTNACFLAPEAGKRLTDAAFSALRAIR